jgi:hypothetical protein
MKWRAICAAGEILAPTMNGFLRTFSKQSKNAWTISGFCGERGQFEGEHLPVDVVLTALNAPAWPRKLSAVCSRTGNTLPTMACAAGLGADFSVGNMDGGLSWTISMLAKDNQTAVSCLCAAKQTSSNKGPGASEMIVMSACNAVIDLNKSLRA